MYAVYVFQMLSDETSWDLPEAAAHEPAVAQGVEEEDRDVQDALMHYVSCKVILLVILLFFGPRTAIVFFNAILTINFCTFCRCVCAIVLFVKVSKIT